VRALVHRQWPLLASVLLFAACGVALEASIVAQQRGELWYPLDDTYIQMAIAKNLARDATWGVAHEYANAGSSLLWPLMLSAVYLIAGVQDWVPLALNVVAGIATLWIASRVLERYASTGVRAAALALIVIAVPLFHTARIGMEHVVVCLVAVTAVALVARACAEELPRWWLPLVGATLLLARFDLAAVAAPLAIVIALNLGWRPAAGFLLGAIAPVVASAVIAWQHGWPLLPTPVLLKHRFSMVDSLFEWLVSFGAGGLALLVRTPILLIVVIAGLWLMVQWRDNDTRGRERIIMLFVAIAAILLHVQFGQTGWMYRYESHLVTMGIVAMASAASWWRGWRASARPAAALLVLVVIATVGWRTFAAVRELRDQTRADSYTALVNDFLEQFPPPGGIIIGHVGLIGYRTDTPMIDAMGLLTPELVAPGRIADPVMLRRIAAERGVRFSVEHVADWLCIGRWTVDGLTERLFVADADTAGRMRANIEAFAREGMIVAEFGDRACSTTGLTIH
jgi:hypothetical protein